MSEGESGLQLLFIVVKNHHQRDMILEGFLELGITGATLIESRGMAQVLARDVPIFAGLVSLFPGGNTDSHLILSLLENDKLEPAIHLTEDVCGDFSAPGSGILFSVPVTTAHGLAGEIR